MGARERPTAQVNGLTSQYKLTLTVGMKTILSALLIIALSSSLSAHAENSVKKEAGHAAGARMGDPIPGIDITVNQSPGGIIDKPKDNIYFLKNEGQYLLLEEYCGY